MNRQSSTPLTNKIVSSVIQGNDSKLLSLEDRSPHFSHDNALRIKDTLVSTSLQPDELAIVNEVKRRAESGFNKLKQPLQSVMRARLPIDMGEPEDWASIASRLKLTQLQVKNLYKQGCDLIALARKK